MAEEDRQLPKEDRADIRPEFDKTRGDISPDELLDAEEESGLYKDHDDNETTPSGKTIASELDDAESTPSTDSAPGGLYNETGEQGGRRGRLRKFRSSSQGLLRRAIGNKWLLGLTVSASTLIIIGIILLSLLLGGLKVVQFAEHIAAYQFARTTQQMADNTERLTAEKMGIDVADKGAVRSAYDNIKAKYYDTPTGKVKDQWSKLDKYRPDKVIANYQQEGTLRLNYRDGKFGRQILNSVTINGEEVDIARGTPKNLIPGIKFGNNINFSRDFAPDLISSLKASDIGPITRAKIARQIRQELDVSLTAWALARYAGKTDKGIEAQTERDAYNRSMGGQATAGLLPDENFPAPPDRTQNPDAPSTVNDAASKVNQDVQKALSTEAGARSLAEAADAGDLPIPDTAVQDIKKSIIADSLTSVSGALKSVLRFINPAYAYATPVCLVYDGSLQKSGPSIDSQSQQLERSALWVQTAKDTVKNGYQVNAEAVHSADWKLGDITKSNAEKRANGVQINTSSYFSTETSGTGQYSIADWGLGSEVGGFVDSLAKVCPALTNLWVAAGVGTLSVAAALPDLIANGLSRTAGEEATNITIKSLAGKLVSKSSAAKDFGSKFLKDTLKTGAAVGGATYVAYQLTSNQAGLTHSSLATGQPYADDADSGLNIYDNQINQRQFYGAPLSDSELGQDHSDSMHFLASQNSQKSIFDRYISTQNPDSLVSHMAMSMSGYFSRSFFASLTQGAKGLLSPLRNLGSVFSPLINRPSFASANITSANTYYGNVQFGWTREEKKLMNHDDYQHLPNQLILDQSGKEDEISGKYNQCFDGSKTIGQMLAEGLITRNSEGNVLADDSLCSPRSLGPQNPQYGDLVFRWRVAQSYSNTLDQLTSEQVLKK